MEHPSILPDLARLTLFQQDHQQTLCPTSRLPSRTIHRSWSTLGPTGQLERLRMTPPLTSTFLLRLRADSGAISYRDLDTRKAAT